MITNHKAAMVALAGAVIGGCASVPNSNEISIARLDQSGVLSVCGEHVNRILPQDRTDFIVDQDRHVWKQGPEVSACPGGFAIPSIQAFGTYYLPASESESHLVLGLIQSSHSTNK